MKYHQHLVNLAVSLISRKGEVWVIMGDNLYQENSEIIDHNQIMTMLGIKRTTLFKLLHSGRLPVVKIGKRYVTTKKQFYDWIKKNEGQEIL